ncbi:MAG: LrgB family protein [Hahellaceae bacterium]|nr:LrgB family protein [Hahellaceae bacterium]MCP5211254.1 LrgB family protein [Hahellaceae bacterium]
MIATSQASLLTTLTTTPLFSLSLTLAAYLLGIFIYRKTGQISILQPVVTGIVFVIGSILLLELDLASYLQGVDILNTLLGTATVALAYPLYQNFSMIKSNVAPIAFCIVVCGTISSGVAVFLAWSVGASTPVLLSIAPKSITTPFAIGVAESIGGYPSLAAALVIVTGIIVAVIATPTFRLMNINSPKIQGLAMGMTGHGIATTRAFEISNETGAFSALGMGLMGVYISTILPYIALLMRL